MPVAALDKVVSELVQGGPFSPVANPYPLYARLRREAPAYVMPGAYSGGQTALITRYDDAREVLRDASRFSSRVNAHDPHYPLLLARHACLVIHEIRRDVFAEGCGEEAGHTIPLADREEVAM